MLVRRTMDDPILIRATMGDRSMPPTGKTLRIGR
jgi:hypothetical protein